MKKILCFFAVIVVISLQGCKDAPPSKSASDGSVPTEQAAKEREISQREKAAKLYSSLGTIDPNTKKKAITENGYFWGEVNSLTTDSAKALMLMAFERRVLTAKGAIDSSRNKLGEKIFDQIYERTRSSLKVVACEKDQSELRAICKITVDQWNKKAGMFENVVNIQGFARGSKTQSWRPVAMAVKRG